MFLSAFLSSLVPVFIMSLFSIFFLALFCRYFPLVFHAFFVSPRLSQQVSMHNMQLICMSLLLLFLTVWAVILAVVRTAAQHHGLMHHAMRTNLSQLHAKASNMCTKDVVLSLKRRARGRQKDRESEGERERERDGDSWIVRWLPHLLYLALAERQQSKNKLKKC